MTPCEVRSVKRRLESYSDLLAMAAEKDREALMLELDYIDAATPGAIRYSHEPGGSGSGKDKDSIYIEIFSKQMEAEKKAAQYRLQAAQIERFIGMIESESQPILQAAYIDGKRYWEIGKDSGYSKTGVQTLISRCLEKVPATVAEAAGLL